MAGLTQNLRTNLKQVRLKPIYRSGGVLFNSAAGIINTHHVETLLCTDPTLSSMEAP